MHDDHESEGAYYLLDGVPVLLDPDRGPRGPAGERVDCVAWMDRAVRVSRAEYLAIALVGSADLPPTPEIARV